MGSTFLEGHVVGAATVSFTSKVSLLASTYGRACSGSGPGAWVSGALALPAAAAPTTSNNVEVDLLRSMSDSFSSNALPPVPATSATATPEANTDSTASFPAPSSESSNFNQEGNIYFSTPHN
ncbi:putative clathrin interactor EPSIN 3-like [Sesbania bispinosa]|nr:putative clathrin interactor EPSIN 3-like [Sesbania bispinosa]